MYLVSCVWSTLDVVVLPWLLVALPWMLVLGAICVGWRLGVVSNCVVCAWSSFEVGIGCRVYGGVIEWVSEGSRCKIWLE